MKSSSASSVALLVMIDVLFVANFFFIRSLRATVNEDRTSKLRSLTTWIFNNKVARGIKAFRRVVASPSSNATDGKKCDVGNVLYAVLLGKAKVAPTVATPLPTWKPLPHNLGIVSTSIALLLSILLLSLGDMLSDDISTTLSGESTQLCETENFAAKIAGFESHILSENVTNFAIGSKQHELTLKFRDALLNDTTLYGTPGYECPDPTNGGISTKRAWNAKNLTYEYGPYFPGYCSAALDLALEEAMNKQCTQKKRVCVTGPFGWIKWKCETIEFPVPCPPHTWDSEQKDVKNYRTAQRIRSERQMEAMGSDASDEDIQALQDSSAQILGDLLNQIDIAGTVYSLYMIVALFFPTPMIMYKPSIKIQVKKLLFGTDKYAFIGTFVLIWWVLKYVNVLLQTPELKIYFANLFTDPCFVDGDFIQKRYEIVRDTCSKLVEYEEAWGLAKNQIDEIKPEVDAFFDFEDCRCYFPGAHVLKSFFGIRTLASHDRINWGEYEMREGQSEEPTIAWSQIGFDLSWKVRHRRGYSSVWSPADGSAFLGDETICVDHDYAKQEILIADDANITFWKSWIASGLLASILVKFAITNFGIALLKLADPFSLFGGMYECPPLSALSNQSDTEAQKRTAAVLFVNKDVQDQKEEAFKAIAIRESVVWGIITNLSLISLIVSTVADIESFEELDKTIFAVIVSITLVLPIACIGITKLMNARVREQTRG